MTGHDGIRPLININHYFFYKNLLIGIFYVYFKFQTYLKKKKKKFPYNALRTHMQECP